MKSGNIYVILLIFIVMITSISSCKKKKIQEEKNQITRQLETGIWQVQRVMESGHDVTSQYNGYNFIFGEDNILTATNGTDSYQGTWHAEEVNNHQCHGRDKDFILHFNIHNEFENLNNDWNVIHNSDEKLELSENEIEGPDLLIFNRL